MYYQDYDDYMRNGLGYDTRQETMMDMNIPTYQMPEDDYLFTEDQNMPMENENFERLYPEIYKIVYPVVRRVIEGNVKPITEELVQEFTDMVFHTIEPETRTTVDTNVKMELKNGDVVNPNAKSAKKEVRETRQVSSLRDLVQILILRELLGRPPAFRPRPPFPGPRPPVRPRPPFPGPGIRPPVAGPRPPFPGPRPPMHRTEIDYSYPENFNSQF